MAKAKVNKALRKCARCKWLKNKTCMMLGTIRPVNASEDKADKRCQWAQIKK